LGDEAPSLEVPLRVSAGTGLCALTIEPQEIITIAKRSSQRRYAFEKPPMSLVNVPRALKTSPPFQSQIRQKQFSNRQ
jgi:hypothetical protein